MIATAIGIGEVEPTHSDGLVPLVGLSDSCQQLVVLLCAPGDILDECLLNVGIKISISHHVVEPPVFQDGGKNFAHAGCQCDRSKVTRLGWVAGS